MTVVTNFEDRCIIADVGLTSMGSCVHGRGTPVEIKYNPRWVAIRDEGLNIVISHEGGRILIPILGKCLSLIGECNLKMMLGRVVDCVAKRHNGVTANDLFWGDEASPKVSGPYNMGSLP